MSYCEIGVEASIQYQFADSAKKVYKTKQTPVDVVTSIVPRDTPEGLIPNNIYQVQTIYTDPISGQTFIQSLSSGGASLPLMIAPILSLYLFSETDGSGTWGLKLHMQDSSTPETAPRVSRTENLNNDLPIGNVNGYRFDPIDLYKIYDIVPFPSDNPPDPTKNRCKITISHMGTTLFTDKGNCPVKFEVICGEQCPEGYLKCASTNYPGYCCLPCEPIKAEIKAIKSHVASINRKPVSNG